MSMTTSYRYEVENPSAKTLRKALERQKQRIKNDEEMIAKEVAVKNDVRTILIADWVEKLDETCFKKKAKRNAEEIGSELLHANKEMISVRRAQLCSLLKQEEDMYSAELSKFGKAFHSQRI